MSDARGPAPETAEEDDGLTIPAPPAGASRLALPESRPPRRTRRKAAVEETAPMPATADAPVRAGDAADAAATAPDPAETARAAAAAVLELRDICRSYPQGGGVLEVFKGLSLAIRPGEIVALVGPSGAGKSSLLHIAGLLEAPTDGEILIGGRSCAGLSGIERTRIRRERLGFVYQFHNLLPEFSARENVALPLMVAGRRWPEASREADRLLALLGLGGRLEHRPAQLSGGEQQRVAIARGLANRPALLLADEPTGNLDPRTSALVFDALLAAVRKQGLAALIATHNMALAEKMDRVLELSDGRLVARTRP